MKKVDEGLINHEELLKLLQAWTKWYRLFFFFESCESEKNFRTTPDLQNESTRCQADPPNDNDNKSIQQVFWGKNFTVDAHEAV